MPETPIKRRTAIGRLLQRIGWLDPIVEITPAPPREGQRPYVDTSLGGRGMRPRLPFR